MDNGADGDDKSGLATPGAAAAYIASMSFELSRLARHHGLDPLSFILEMARIEADHVTKDTEGTELG
jgi:hypothetical protein